MSHVCNLLVNGHSRYFQLGGYVCIDLNKIKSLETFSGCHYHERQQRAVFPFLETHPMDPGNAAMERCD